MNTEENLWRSSKRNPLGESGDCLYESTAVKLIQGKTSQRLVPESGSKETENDRDLGGITLSALQVVIPPLPLWHGLHGEAML